MIRRTQAGFTLAEVLVALTIGTFISLVAVGALKTVSSGAQVVDRASETSAELRFAARMIAKDLRNLYRDADRNSMRLIGASQTAEDTEKPPHLCFYMVGRTKARPTQPESDVYEVEYILRSDGEDEMPGSQQETGTTLYRRLWPNPDRRREPGGILTPIAKGIDVFGVRFYDGREWTTEWPEERQAIPELVEVTLAMQPEGKGSPLIETFITNFPRLAPESAPPTQMRGGGNERGSNNGAPPAGQSPPPGGSR